MAYITPDTTIYLLTGVPLSPDYFITLYWEDSGSQLEYFQGFAKYTLTDYSYQRKEKGVLRCAVLADNIYSCNYMMYQNTAYGSKWFYCFITKIEYINDHTSDVYFETDVLQTWHFNYTLRQSYIKRQTVVNDWVGKNIQPEPLAVSDYGICSNTWTGITEDTYYCIMCICDVNESVDLIYFDRSISGCQVYAFPVSAGGISAMEEVINSYSESPDSIISMYMIPSDLINGDDLYTSSGTYIPSTSTGASNTFTYTADPMVGGTGIGWGYCSAADGRYTPRNCKLYTYPYCYYAVTDSNGNMLTLPYEFFLDHEPNFRIGGNVLAPVELRLSPIGYKGLASATYNRLESLTITDYPMCSWNYDAYKAWLAQNATPITNTVVATLGGSLLTAAGQLLSGNIAGAITSFGSSVGSTVASTANEYYSASIAADVCCGSYANGSAAMSVGTKRFYGAPMSLDSYTLSRYDDYFDVYGYAINTIQTPQRCNREYWTYVQTGPLTYSTNSVPADDMRKIDRIYQNGVVWWNGDYASEIGRFTQYCEANESSNWGDWPEAGSE